MQINFVVLLFTTLFTFKVSTHKQKIASDVREILSSNETVVVVHYGDLNTQSWNNIRLKLSELGIKAKVIPTKVSTRALDETPFQNIAVLFNGSTALIYGCFTEISHLLSCIKTEPKLCLLGGKVFNELLTPKGLENMSNLPSKEVLQQNLSGLLVLPQLQHIMCLNSGLVVLSQLLRFHSSTCTILATGDII